MFTNNQWLDANAGGSGGGDEQQGKKDEQEKKDVLTFEAWLEKQDDTVKALLDGHIKGLRTALGSERESRKDLEKQLRDLAKKAEAGSESQSKLTEMADQIATADRKADFYEAAHRAGVTNLKLAFLVATQDELFDKHGAVNFEAMKKNYPELFGGTANVDGNAGSGTDQEPKPAIKMDDMIRQAAGRK
jgi:hypothetical protein